MTGKKIARATKRTRKTKAAPYKGTSKKRASWAKNEAEYEKGLVDRYVIMASMAREWPTLPLETQLKVTVTALAELLSAKKKYGKYEQVFAIARHYQRKRGLREQ